MKILALDTSTIAATVAVIEDEKLLGEFLLNHKKTHSQKLLPMIKEIMEELELKPEDVDVFAASTGPGSFTGLRIGVTTIKAMAYALDKPVVGVPTLDVLAYNSPIGSFMVCPIIDARNNQVYTALYQGKGSLRERVTEYLGIPVADLVREIRERKEKVVFAGDAVDIHSRYLIDELGELCTFAPGNLCLPRASSVAHLGYAKASQGLLQSSFELVPFYLRKSQAEREYEQKLCNNSCGADQSAIHKCSSGQPG